MDIILRNKPAMMAIIAVLMGLVTYSVTGDIVISTILACTSILVYLMSQVQSVKSKEGFFTIKESPYYANQKKSITTEMSPEGYPDKEPDDAATLSKEPFPQYKEPFTFPTPENPLMNSTIATWSEKPNHPEAAPSFDRDVTGLINRATLDDVTGSIMKNECDTKDSTKGLRAKLFQDLGDEITFNDFMRNFTANPSTTTPNDQMGFAAYCYGDVGSCKRGGEYKCSPIVAPSPDGGVIRTEAYERTLTSGGDPVAPQADGLQPLNNDKSLYLPMKQ